MVESGPLGIAADILATVGGINEFQPVIATAAPTPQVLENHHEEKTAGIHPASGYTRGTTHI